MASRSNCSKVLDFFLLIGRLKTTQRTGWVRRGVSRPESIADHMYRMSVMSFMIDSNCTKLNKDRCIKISLVHDMAECIVGDLTPADGVSKEDKHAQEKAAMIHIKTLAGEETGEELFQLWEEYENQSSDEAVFVKDLDRFDMILQAHEYETGEQQPGRLQDFYDSTKGKFQSAAVIEWVEELYRRRRQGIQSHQSSGDAPGS